MANTSATIDLVTYEVAMYFANSLKGVGQFNRQYSDEFAKKGGKVGDTVRIRLPQQFTASSGAALVQQNLLDRTVNLVVNRRRHIGFAFGSQEASLDLDDIRNRYVQPAAETLASIFDQLAMGDVFKAVYNAVGTPGTTPSTTLSLSQARVKILDQAGPDDGLVAVLDPWASANLANTTSAIFHPGRQVTENWEKGMFANDQMGISKFFEDQNVPRFTTGATTTSTPLVAGAGQTGSSIATDGWGSGATALVEGDIVTFAGVYAVNPLSKESTGRLMQFALTADVSDSSGSATLSITPSIITTGALQNVTAAPADNAVVTYWSMTAGGSQTATVTPQSLIFHPNAFACAMVDLPFPNGGANASRVGSKQLNVALRYVEQFDITSDDNLNRLDILFGTAPVQERMAVRYVG